MAEGDIPIEVRRFIERTIDSVDQLEVLLFLMSNTDRDWSSEEIGQRIRLAESAVESNLVSLTNAGLVVVAPESRYRYAPKSSALADEVAVSLDKAYREGRQSVIQLILSRPLENIRIFADAFRIKREDD